jgi:1-pyrroline-4-hydroxy-2-carboxylate deaminase
MHAILSEWSSASKPGAEPYTIVHRASNRRWRMKSLCSWSGVFPAATTQFDAALDLDLAATRRVQTALIRDGVHGLVLMGTVGEGNSLSAVEKRKVLEAAVEASEGKVPVIAGVSELTTAAAANFARDAEQIGASGLMVLPAMVYVPTPAELEYHFRAVAGACALPIMLYNNPPSYRVNIDLETLERLTTSTASSR